MADVPPLPKKKPVLDLKKDLRLISLTSCVSKVAKEFVVEDVIKPAVLDVIRGNQHGAIPKSSSLSGPKWGMGHGAIPKSSTTMALISMLHTWSLGTDGNGVTVRTVVKALANGFNICFNILSILLNGNVESVCHPLSALLKRVEAKLYQC